MTYADLVDRWGANPAAIAKALGVSRQRVEHWRKTQTIPEAAQALIQIKTRGRLRANLASATQPNG